MIQNVEQIKKIIRQTLIFQSQLPEKFVRSSHSLYGTDLDKNVDYDIFNTISSSDLLVLFELMTADATSNMTERDRKDENFINYYQSFKIHIILYGDESLTFAHILKARLLTEEVREELQIQGIYLSNISNIEKIDEFKNGVVWMRNDFDIYVSCQFNFTPVMTNADIEKLNTITIYDE